MLQKMLKAGTWVFLGILLGRFAGFLREAVLAASLGATQQADYAVLVLTVPDLLINMLVGGAMGAALIPEFKQLNREKAWPFYLQATLVIGACFAVLAWLLTWQSDALVHLFAPGFAVDGTERAGHQVAIVLWSIPITAMTAAGTAFLQSNNRFAIPALGTLFFNSVLIVGLLLPWGTDTVETMSYAVILAALFRWSTQFKNIWELRAPSPPKKTWWIDRGIVMRYGQALLTGGLLFLLPIISRTFASWHGEGSLAIMTYTSKFIELPLAVFLTIFSVVLFPSLAEFTDETKKENGEKLAEVGLTMILTLSVPIALALAWFHKDFVSIMFGWGKMTASSLHTIGMLAAIGLLSLPAQGMLSLSQAVFNAKKDMRTPFVCSVVAVLSYLVLAWWLSPILELMGLVVALVVVYWCLFASHIVLLKRKHQIDFTQVFRSLETGRMLLVALLVFVPFAAAGAVAEAVWFRILCAVLGAGLAFAGGFLTLKRYRMEALNLWKRKRRAA